MHKRTHKFAGHISRLSKHDPDRLSRRMLSYRNIDWIRKQTITNNGKTDQKHCRKLRTWRWERTISQYHGHKWHELAEDVVEWNRQSDMFAIWLGSPKGVSRGEV